MLVAANDQAEAIELAQSQSHATSHTDEGLNGANGYGDEGAALWADSTKSFCREIGVAGPAVVMSEIIVTDYIYA